MNTAIKIIEGFLFWPYVLSWAFWTDDQWDESSIARPITAGTNIVWLTLIFGTAYLLITR